MLFGTALCSQHLPTLPQTLCFSATGKGTGLSRTRTLACLCHCAPVPQTLSAIPQVPHRCCRMDSSLSGRHTQLAPPSCETCLIPGDTWAYVTALSQDTHFTDGKTEALDGLGGRRWYRMQCRPDPLSQELLPLSSPSSETLDGNAGPHTGTKLTVRCPTAA